MLVNMENIYNILYSNIIISTITIVVIVLKFLGC